MGKSRREGVDRTKHIGVYVVMSTTKDALVVKNLPLSVRLEPDERRALGVAAGNDGRSLSSMTRVILIDWLQKQGYLIDPKLRQAV